MGKINIFGEIRIEGQDNKILLLYIQEFCMNAVAILTKSWNMRYRSCVDNCKQMC